MQDLLTALIVASSAAYAGWVLMPQAWRRGLLGWLLGRPTVPAPASGCGGCGGCAGPAVKTSPAAGATAAPGTAVVTLHRRRPGA